MKKLSFALTLVLAAGASFAQSNTVVRWNQIVGVITAPGVDNPVGTTTDANGNKNDQIHSGTLPWTTRGGHASVNLTTGEGSFDVEGLVLNGGNATGTPGPISSVVGTLVCNPGTTSQAIIDSTPVNLLSDGKAEHSFKINVPATCATPLFLIRAPQAGLRWLAAGAINGTRNSSGY
jgi:hypothetical protein